MFAGQGARNYVANPWNRLAGSFGKELRQPCSSPARLQDRSADRPRRAGARGVSPWYDRIYILPKPRRAGGAAVAGRSSLRASTDTAPRYIFNYA